MGDYEAVLIAEGLKANTTLSDLDLYAISGLRFIAFFISRP